MAAVVEVFVSRGRAAGVLAYLPSSVDNTAVHLFSIQGVDEGSSGGRRGSHEVVAQDVVVYELGCGWLDG